MVMGFAVMRNDRQGRGEVGETEENVSLFLSQPRRRKEAMVNLSTTLENAKIHSEIIPKNEPQ
jgi:hypothetical protein